MITKIAILGATGSAKKRTAPALREYTDIKISAIQGRNEDKLKEMCSEYDIPAYFLSIEDMLNCADYDIIYIASPPFMHYDELIKCFEYCKPIVCEKPLCLDSVQAYEVYRISEEKNIPIMVAHQMRHQRAYDFIKKYIKSGKLGRIRFVYGKWDYILDVTKPSSTWKTDFNKSGGGVMNDVGIHILDFVIGLFGFPKHVYGCGDMGKISTVYANETAMLTYDGFDCVVKCSFEKDNTDNEFMICGTKACIRIPEGMGEKSIELIHIDSGEGRKTVYFGKENLYANEVIDFVKHIGGDKSVSHRITTAEDSLLCTEIIDVLREMY